MISHACDMRPWSRTSSRSASASASSTSWVTSRIAIEWRRHSSITSWCISMRVRASRALNGSSSSSSSGLLTSARASETRWACPPESCSGQASCFSLSPTSASVASASSWRRSRCSVLSRASATFSRTDFHGSSRGSWKATPVRPCTSTSPAGTGSRPVRLRSSVDLPQPLRPSRATNSPGRMSRSTSRSTWVLPKDRLCRWTRATRSLVRVSRWSVLRRAMRGPSSRGSGRWRRSRARAGCRRRGRGRSRRSAGTPWPG